MHETGCDWILSRASSNVREARAGARCPPAHTDAPARKSAPTLAWSLPCSHAGTHVLAYTPRRSCCHILICPKACSFGPTGTRRNRRGNRTEPFCASDKKIPADSVPRGNPTEQVSEPRGTIPSGLLTAVGRRCLFLRSQAIPGQPPLSPRLFSAGTNSARSVPGQCPVQCPVSPRSQRPVGNRRGITRVECTHQET